MASARRQLLVVAVVVGCLPQTVERYELNLWGAPWEASFHVTLLPPNRLVVSRVVAVREVPDPRLPFREPQVRRDSVNVTLSPAVAAEAVRWWQAAYAQDLRRCGPRVSDGTSVGVALTAGGQTQRRQCLGQPRAEGAGPNVAALLRLLNAHVPEQLHIY